ncbi:hypothetical protein O9992_02850 [Vibrio lentus]|nr:hypothetical protein [Vibrio lentus]
MCKKNAAGETQNGVLTYLVADDASRAAGKLASVQLAGGYMFKMFGLPAAIAIAHSAKPENR